MRIWYNWVLTVLLRAWWHVRAWKVDRQHVRQTTGWGTFVPLVCQPVEAFRLDWATIIGSERVELQIARIKLSHGRAFLVRTYLRQTHKVLFRCALACFP